MREVLDHQPVAVGDKELDQYEQGSHGAGIMPRARLAATADEEYGAS